MCITQRLPYLTTIYVKWYFIYNNIGRLENSTSMKEKTSSSGRYTGLYPNTKSPLSNKRRS